MLSLQDLMKMPLDKRKAIQEKAIRGYLIGKWAPREPQMMKVLRDLLRDKSSFTQNTVSRILARLGSMAVYTAVATCDEMVEFINNLPDDYEIVCGPCACRINTAEEAGFDARDLKGSNLDYCRKSPLNLDIQFGKCGEKFGRCEGYRPISKEELIQMEYDCRDMGLVSNCYVMMGGEGSICHCSSKTCVPLITYHLSNEARFRFYQRGESIAVTNRESCNGHGHCVQVCHFGAREILETDSGRQLVVHYDRCHGCGLCARVCPEGAVKMAQRTKVGKRR